MSASREICDSPKMPRPAAMRAAPVILEALRDSRLSLIASSCRSISAIRERRGDRVAGREVEAQPIQALPFCVGGVVDGAVVDPGLEAVRMREGPGWERRICQLQKREQALPTVAVQAACWR
jgi:hypothetical protein